MITATGDTIMTWVCFWRHGSHWDRMGEFPDGRGFFHCWACRKFRIK